MSNSKITTVPNQNVMQIHREPTDKNFIAINKYNFTKAYRDMSNSSAALGLYIWLVGNKDNYRFAFSPQAIENQLGMASTSCRGAFKKLVDLGYIVRRKENSNIYDFYEVTTLDSTLQRKVIADEMLMFDNMTEAPEAEEPTETAPIPLARPGEFTF